MGGGEMTTLDEQQGKNGRLMPGPKGTPAEGLSGCRPGIVHYDGYYACTAPEGARRLTSPWLTCYMVPKPPLTSHGTWGQSQASLFLSFPLYTGLESSKEQKTSRGQQRKEVVTPPYWP